MRKLLIIILTLLFTSQAWGVTPKVIPSEDMTYLGAFRLPYSSGYNYVIAYNGEAAPSMSFYPPDGTLLVQGGPASGGNATTKVWISKIGIPALIIDPTKTFSNLNSGTFQLSSPYFVDITNGLVPGGGANYVQLGDVHYYPKQANQATDKLYWTIFGGYTPTNVWMYANGQLFWGETDLTSLSNHGAWRLYADSKGVIAASRNYGKYLFHAPADWADAYVGGRYLLTGYSREGSNYGPPVYAFAPWNGCCTDTLSCDTACTGADIPPDAEDGATPAMHGSDPIPTELKNSMSYVRLMDYKASGSSYTNNEWTAKSVDDSSPSDQWTNGAWLQVGTKRAIAFSVQKGMRTWTGQLFCYPTRAPWMRYLSASGYGTDPYYMAIYFWEQDDLTASACGSQATPPAACSGVTTKQPEDIQPYAELSLTNYFFTPNADNTQLGGMAYDETNNILYVQEIIAYNQSIIHAFQLVASASSTLSTVTAPVLSLTSATKTSVQLSWTASTESSGKPVTYIVYINGYPRAMTTDGVRTFTDNYPNYYNYPLSYKVVAKSFDGNTTDSNTLVITESDGISTPITIFVTGCVTPSMHEASYIPKWYKTYPQSYQPGYRGGTGPYTWTWTGSIPTGMSINSSSGLISGTPTDGSSQQYSVITITDSLGNTQSRRVQTGTMPASFYGTEDVDGDSVKSIPNGGTDTDDTSCNATVGAMTQPPPTNSTVTGSTSSTISLSWTSALPRNDPSGQGITGGGGSSKLKLTDLQYTVYHGTSSGVYTESKFVGRATSYTWTGLSSATHYFAITAIDWYGLESANSTEVHQTLGGGDITPPTVQSATIPIAGTSISLLFDEIVTRVAETGWTLTMTGGAVTMTYSSGSGSSTLVYTLSRTIYQGETGTIAWTNEADTIEDTSENDLATFSGFTVTNSSAEIPVTGFNGQAYGAYYAEGWDQNASIVQVSDGFVIVGPTWSYSWVSGPGTETSRIMMLKINTSGVEQWRKIIGPEGYDITTKVRSTVSWIPTKVILSGTDIVICGYKSTIGTQGVDAFLMKFNSSGTLTWDRTFNNVTYPTKDDYLWDVVERTGGGFAACGQGWSGPSYGTSFWLLLTDANGQNETYTYYTYLSKGWSRAQTIRKTADNGFLMAGYTDDGTGLVEDYYAVKTNSSGVSSWINLFDNSSRRDKATGVEEDASGNFWIFGRSQLSGYENTKIWIVKTDDELTQLATYTIGDSDNAHAYAARGSVKLASGNFLIVGYTNVSAYTGYHGYVAEIDSSTGAVVQSSTIGATTGWTEDYLFKVIQSADEDYYHIIGTDNQAFTTAYDFWYLKLAATDLSVQNTTSCESKTTYYYDKDLDGLGNNNQYGANSTAQCCSAMPGYVLTHDDDNDTGGVTRTRLGSGSTMKIGSGDIFDLIP